MVTKNRIRLTGLLTENPANGRVFPFLGRKPPTAVVFAAVSRLPEIVSSTFVASSHPSVDREKPAI
jgi:hypothetical protein